jgi:hypothetical protein
MADRAPQPDIKMNAADLYREDNFTDKRIGTIQMLTPVKADGSPDASRSVLFLGQTQVLTPAGALPLNFEIEAQTLEDAIAAFGDGARQALAGTMQRLEEMRREAASSIIVPGAGGPPGGGFPGGGMPQGGGLKLP